MAGQTDYKQFVQVNVFSAKEFSFFILIFPVLSLHHVLLDPSGSLISFATHFPRSWKTGGEPVIDFIKSFTKPRRTQIVRQ